MRHSKPSDNSVGRSTVKACAATAFSASTSAGAPMDNSSTSGSTRTADNLFTVSISSRSPCIVLAAAARAVRCGAFAPTG